MINISVARVSDSSEFPFRLPCCFPEIFREQKVLGQEKIGTEVSRSTSPRRGSGISILKQRLGKHLGNFSKQKLKPKLISISVARVSDSSEFPFRLSCCFPEIFREQKVIAQEKSELKFLGRPVLAEVMEFRFWETP